MIAGDDVVVAMIDVAGGEDASDVFVLDEEELEILFDTVVLVAIIIIVYSAIRKRRRSLMSFVEVTSIVCLRFRI